LAVVVRALPNGQTVTLLRYGLADGAVDADGNDAPSWAPVDVVGCAVWPRAGAEAVQGQTLVTDNLTVIMPWLPAPVGPLDRVSWNGNTYRQTSPPNAYRSPLTGHGNVTELTLTRVTG